MQVKDVKTTINNYAYDIPNMEVKNNNYSCKDCGFYHDCPMDYDCPAKEMIEDICSKEGGIFTIIDGRIIGVYEREEE